MNRDLALGCATLAVGAAYCSMAATIPESRLADAVGPQGLPRTYAALLAGLSLVLIAKSLRTRRSNRESRIANRESRIANHKSPLWRVAGMLAIGVIYILAVPWLGYLLSIAALILATTYYQGGAINRQVAVVALSGGIFFWLLFVVMMGIAQPPGWFPPSP